MNKFLVIEYDPEMADDGEPIDLYDYLLNEFNNHGIKTRIIGYDFDPRKEQDYE